LDIFVKYINNPGVTYFMSKKAFIFLICSFVFCTVFICTSSSLFASIEEPGNPLIIFRDKLGEQLINFEEIPENIDDQYLIDQENETKTIIISGRQKENEKIYSKKILDFKEAVYDFKISSNGKFIAYYSWDDGLLKIIDLSIKEIIWETTIKHPTYAWHPHKPILAFSNSGETGYNISLFNPTNLNHKILLNNNEGLCQYINYLCWSPDGKTIAFTILEGLPDAHGYISNLNLIDELGRLTSLVNISDINFITWSPSGKYLAYSQFLQTDISASTISIFDVLTNKIIPFTKVDTSQINPIFTPDGKYLLYCDINGLSEEINLYNLKEGKEKVLKNELRYVDDFCWLDNETLVYTFGDLPQIKLFNIKNKKSEVIGQGYSLVTINNLLYFLRTSNNNQKTALYVFAPIQN